MAALRDLDRVPRDLVPVPRDFRRALIVETDRSPFGRCPYCGHPCYGRVCGYCRDLAQLEHQT